MRQADVPGLGQFYEGIYHEPLASTIVFNDANHWEIEVDFIMK